MPEPGAVLLPLVGFAVGVFGSFTGLGGAILLTPALAVGFGLPYNAAIGCSVAQMIGMSAAGAFRHAQLGHVQPRIAAVFLTGSLPGAVLGRRTLQELHGRYGEGGDLRLALDLFYGTLIVAGAIVLLLRWRRHRAGRNRRTSGEARVRRRELRLATLLLGGLVAGFLAGLLAIGGGLVAVPLLSGILGVRIVEAVGISVFQIVFTAGAATVVSLGTTDLRWVVVLLLLLGSVPGALVGPRLLRRAVREPEP